MPRTSSGVMPPPEVVDLTTHIAIAYLRRHLIAKFVYDVRGELDSIHAAHESENPDFHLVSFSFFGAEIFLEQFDAGMAVLS